MGTVSFQQAYDVAAGHFSAGRFREAESVLLRILSKAKDQPECLHMLGLAQHNLGRGTAGIELIRRAIDKSPGNAQFYANLSAVLSSLGDDEAAMNAAVRSTELDPSLAEGHNNQGNILRMQRKIPEAIDAFRKAIAARPDYPEAINNLAMSLLDINQPDEAIVLLNRLLQLRPTYADAYNAMGGAMLLKNRFQESMNAYRKAISLRPQYGDAHTNLGNAMRAQNRLQEALQSYQAALAINPQSAEPIWASGFIALLQGDLVPGFNALEARLFHRDKIASFAQPTWNGEELRGKKIMLVGEQGLGDTIQFVRYAPLMKARGALVAVLCQAELERLLKTCPGVDMVVPDGKAPPTVDYRCPAMSAARVFKTTLQTIPNTVPYLAAEPGLSDAWRERLRKEPPDLRVGVTWTGDRRHKNNLNRSVPRDMLASLAKIPGVRLFSLQVGIDAPPQMTDWTSELSDFADTAALIANLDLVISVDTAVCHLAGAMAKPVWTLVPFAPDWRWLLDRSDSPWYPTMRLFRQLAIGDWSAPMGQVTADLMHLAARNG